MGWYNTPAGCASKLASPGIAAISEDQDSDGS